MCKRAEEVDAEDAAESAYPAAPTSRPRLLTLAKGTRKEAPQEEVTLAAVKMELQAAEVGHVSLATATLL